ncbi:MAG: Maf family protein [Phototrophicales bacterium]|nr:Maf family protein [Phototrophicales bacterium]
MTQQTFILASGSPRRWEMITSLGIDFTIIKPDIDEAQHPTETPLAYVQRLSSEKADAVAQRLTTPATILAADTIVILSADTIGITEQGQLLGKPENPAMARDMLIDLRNRPHVVITSFTLLRLGDTPQRVSDFVQTRVFMRDYTDTDIEAYIATGDPFDKAGGYAIQHTDFMPVARIEGCYNNVVGLPLCVVKRGLQQVGWDTISASEYCDCPLYEREML